ncbi:TIGR03808 family TAT-translocated repetitive protein [Ahrensia sp. R2A130]|uniref:TIGR03808 family TAT-translocated repetitive protein n=1 Tax=Ahrensia sp. R2A130 TaxID=744979 RepID=UPI0001E0E0C2|nr:TIGR03808 family TAT-translocated repetitive protein [Ahrensia sp. R2A130]EFL88922.1 nitrous oxidase accessory protein [Ahrensia sp. R2A130]
MLRRRFIISALASVAAVPAAAQIQSASLRGSLDATSFGVVPGNGDDQSAALKRALEKASAEDKAVFLPPGVYGVSNLELPMRTRLIGISGATRLIYSGGGAMLTATGCERVEIADVSFDGANRPLADNLGALLQTRACPRVVLDNCTFAGSAGAGMFLEACGGRIHHCSISGAASVAGIYAVGSTGLSITDNEVRDCADGGILVHRWEIGEDNTIISGNRIERIGARSGGTGQYGNGINIFRAGGVNISNNHLKDCAFSAIRANSGNNVAISGNTCLRSGETAIYSEFAFEGAMVANNIVDGGTTGVSIVNFNEGGRLAVVANNLIRNMSATGPYPADIDEFGTGISVEAETTVTGNVVEGAPNMGIGMGWGPYMRNVVASGNILRNCRTGIVPTVVEGAGSAIITNNVIDRPTRGGIIGQRWREVATGELVGRTSGVPEHLTLANNRVTKA